MNEPSCLVYQHRTVAIKEGWVAKLVAQPAKVKNGPGRISKEVVNTP
jgi:hypothetical protein